MAKCPSVLFTISFLMMLNILLAFSAAAVPRLDDFRDLSVMIPRFFCQLCVLSVANRVMAFLEIIRYQNTS